MRIATTSLPANASLIARQMDFSPEKHSRITRSRREVLREKLRAGGDTDNHTAEEAVVASTSMCSQELLIENELVEVVELPGLDSADQVISFHMFSRAETHGNIYPSTPRWLFMMAGFTSGHLGYDSTDKNLSIKSNVSMFTGFACVVSFLPPDHFLLYTRVIMLLLFSFLFLLPLFTL